MIEKKKGTRKERELKGGGEGRYEGTMYRRYFNNSEIQDQERGLVDKHRRSVQLFHIHLRTLLAAALSPRRLSSAANRS